jgi:hypothetical protein
MKQSRRKDDSKKTILDRHCPILNTNNFYLYDPPLFSLYTILKRDSRVRWFLGLNSPFLVWMESNLKIKCIVRGRRRRISMYRAK